MKTGRTTFAQVRRVFFIRTGIAISQHRSTCANVGVLGKKPMVPSKKTKRKTARGMVPNNVFLVFGVCN